MVKDENTCFLTSPNLKVWKWVSRERKHTVIYGIKGDNVLRIEWRTNWSIFCGYLKRERVVNSTGGTLEEVNIQGLQPGTTYMLRVVAMQAGSVFSTSSDPLSIRTQVWPLTKFFSYAFCSYHWFSWRANQWPLIVHPLVLVSNPWRDKADKAPFDGPKPRLLRCLYTHKQLTLAFFLF